MLILQVEGTGEPGLVHVVVETTEGSRVWNGVVGDAERKQRALAGTLGEWLARRMVDEMIDGVKESRPEFGALMVRLRSQMIAMLDLSLFAPHEAEEPS